MLGIYPKDKLGSQPQSKDTTTNRARLSCLEPTVTKKVKGYWCLSTYVRTLSSFSYESLRFPSSLGDRIPLLISNSLFYLTNGLSFSWTHLLHFYQNVFMFSSTFSNEFCCIVIPKSTFLMSSTAFLCLPWSTTFVCKKLCLLLSKEKWKIQRSKKQK